MSTYGERRLRFFEASFSIKRHCSDYGPISAPTYEFRLNGLELNITVERSKRWGRPVAGYWRTPWFLLQVDGHDGYLCEEYVSGDYPDDEQSKRIAEYVRQAAEFRKLNQPET